MPEYELILKDYGLTDNETRVYLATLKLGTSKANEIAKKANLLRTTTYEVLKTLTEKGIISYVIKSGIKHFGAADPNKLINILEEKKQKLQTILPGLEALKKSISKKPKIEIYEGKEGIKTILNDAIKTKPKELLVYGPYEIFKTFQFYMPHYMDQRIKHKIYARIIQERTKHMEELKKHDKKKYREIRFFPKGFNIKTYNEIYGDKIAIITLNKDQLIGILIENKDIAETYKAIFETMWRIAKK